MDRPDSLPDDTDAHADDSSSAEDFGASADDFVLLGPPSVVTDEAHQDVIPFESGSWHQLPRDVVLLVVQYLSAKDVARLSQVNHRTQRLCHDNAVWARLAKARWPAAMLNDTGYEGWKQLYGEMASRERGVDTIRIVLESGPVLVRTRGQKMKGAVYIHLRKAIRTRGLFLSFTVTETFLPPTKTKTVFTANKSFPQLLGRFPFAQNSKEDMPLAAGSHTFPFEVPSVVISRVLNHNAWLGPTLDNMATHSSVCTLKAHLVVVGMFKSDLTTLLPLQYIVPPVSPAAIVQAGPSVVTWPPAATPNDFQIQFEAPRQRWSSGEIVTVKLNFTNPRGLAVECVEHTFIQNVRYRIQVPHHRLWTWPTVITRFPEAKNQPAFSLVVARRLPTPANHHHSYTCHNVRFSLYYAIRFQVVLQGEKRGRHAIPAVDWIFALVPGGVALDAVPVITGAKASATLASPSVNNTP